MEQKDLQRFKNMLEESKKNIIKAARKTRTEESTFDADDRPDEIDQASSESSHSVTFRLRDREKTLLRKIDKALARIDAGTYGICEQCRKELAVGSRVTNPRGE